MAVEFPIHRFRRESSMRFQLGNARFEAADGSAEIHELEDLVEFHQRFMDPRTGSRIYQAAIGDATRDVPLHVVINDTLDAGVMTFAGAYRTRIEINSGRLFIMRERPQDDRFTQTRFALLLEVQNATRWDDLCRIQDGAIACTLTRDQVIRATQELEYHGYRRACDSDREIIQNGQAGSGSFRAVCPWRDVDHYLQAQSASGHSARIGDRYDSWMLDE